jgi:hypothetical protein
VDASGIVSHECFVKRLLPLNHRRLSYTHFGLNNLVAISLTEQ